MRMGNGRRRDAREPAAATTGRRRGSLSRGLTVQRRFKQINIVKRFCTIEVTRVVYGYGCVVCETASRPISGCIGCDMGARLVYSDIRLICNTLPRAPGLGVCM
jgi:hypothetical protein